MPHSIRKFFNDYIEFYMAEDFDQMTDLFTYPAVILENTRPCVVRHRSEMARALARIRQRRSIAGATQMRPRLSVENVACKPRTSVQISWSYFNADGAEIERSEARYFVQTNTPCGIKIEMIDSMIMNTELPDLVALPFCKN